jgi:hypothetical protein
VASRHIRTLIEWVSEKGWSTVSVCLAHVVDTSVLIDQELSMIFEGFCVANMVEAETCSFLEDNIESYLANIGPAVPEIKYAKTSS